MFNAFKNIFLFLVLLLSFLAKQAMSEEKLLPLSKVINDTQNASYVFKRCSGLYISLIGISGNQINKKIAANYLSASEKFYQSAFSLDFKKIWVLRIMLQILLLIKLLLLVKFIEKEWIIIIY